MLIALAGDVFVSRSKTGILGPLIRWATRRPNDPAWSNHAGIVVQSGWGLPDGDWVDGEGLRLNFVPPFPAAVIVEALLHVERHTLWEAYGPPAGKDRAELIIYRPIRLPSEARSRIAAVAESYVGRRYGFQGLLWHALDAWLTKRGVKGGKDVYLFRHLNWFRNVECSTLVKRAYEGGTSDTDYRDFGLPKGVRANPDDIADFCEARPDLWQRVFGPGQIG